MTNNDLTPTEKHCPRCGKTKPLVEFWKLKTGKYGRQVYCKACMKARAKSPKEKERRRAYHREYQREWAKNRTAEQKERNREYMRDYMRNYNQPNRMAAHNAVRRLILNGTIPHPNFATCEKCGGQAEHYHHPNYKEPENVIPLCALCHASEHAK